MAELTMGIAMSHGPMVVSEVPTWFKIAKMDEDSTLLVDTTGKPVSFGELVEATGNRYAEHATEARLTAQRKQVKASLARLRAEVVADEIDLYVVIGDDQHELFDEDNTPAVGVYYGAELEFTPAGRRGRFGEAVGGLDDVHIGYGMDKRNRWPGHEPFARHLIASLLERHFDVAAVKDPVEPAGLGHAYGVVECQVMETPGDTPLVPLIVNTYWPPNQVSPERCWELGRALRESIESYPEDLRVAVVASGGLSHFVTDEDLDMRTLGPLRDGNPRGLLDLPLHLLNSGNSEIRNWIALAACCEDMSLAWDEYIPVYRTACGTGCGMAFARWGAAQPA
ncbi:MAG TPA: hypothetical protein VFB41_09340 [Solirubrobacteraceae bacterium]|nr:hypothetical protein [Solirubrobacteraceae bacterium]